MLARDRLFSTFIIFCWAPIGLHISLSGSFVQQFSAPCYDIEIEENAIKKGQNKLCRTRTKVYSLFCANSLCPSFASPCTCRTKAVAQTHTHYRAILLEMPPTSLRGMFSGKVHENRTLRGGRGGGLTSQQYVTTSVSALLENQYSSLQQDIQPRKHLSGRPCGVYVNVFVISVSEGQRATTDTCCCRTCGGSIFAGNFYTARDLETVANGTLPVCRVGIESLPVPR